jgi:hypothetical protein
MLYLLAVVTITEGLPKQKMALVATNPVPEELKP